MIIEIKDLPKGQIIKQIKVDVIFDESGAVSTSTENVLVEDLDLSNVTDMSSKVEPEAEPSQDVVTREVFNNDMSSFDDRPELEIPSEMDHKF